MNEEDNKEQRTSTAHPLLKRFSNPQFNPKTYVEEIVSHVDTKGLENTLDQLKESKKVMNEVMGDLIFKKYDSMIKIDEHMNEMQHKVDYLKEMLAEYRIAMQTLEVNILEDAAMAQKERLQEIEREEVRSEIETRIVASGNNRWFEELPEKINLLLAEGKYTDCLALFQEYQKNKSKQESIGLLTLKDCEYAFGSVVLALTKELSVNPHNTMALKNLKELGFTKKAVMAYFAGMSKILKLKLKEYLLIHDSYKKQEDICQVFLGFVMETKKDFEKNFEIAEDERPLLAYLTKWILDELRKFVLTLTEILFKTRTLSELKQFTQAIISIFKANEKDGLSLTVELQRLLLPYYKAKLKGYREANLNNYKKE